MPRVKHAKITPATLLNPILKMMLVMHMSGLSPILHADSNKSTRPVLEEVIVTASKRNENVRTIAGAVSVIGEEQLSATASSNFADYLALSPGVNLSESLPGQAVVTIRGVSTGTYPGLSQSAVGIYFEDIPLTDPGPPTVVPDIDAYDAKRIEILRGPQGALYGSSSLGGALNYIANSPDPREFSFSTELGFFVTEYAESSHSRKLMTNFPIVRDSIALRLVGYYDETPGYIDNLGTGVEGSNTGETKGGRAILGWDITDNSMLKFTTLKQNMVIDDFGYQVINDGELKKKSLLPEPTSNEIRLHVLQYNVETEYGSWILVGGLQKKEFESNQELSSVLGTYDTDQPVTGRQTQSIDGYSAELRFTSVPGDTFSYLAGVSYADRTEDLTIAIDTSAQSNLYQSLYDATNSLDINGLELIENTRLFFERAEITAPEEALFLDGTYHLFDSLKLSAGGRYYRNTLETSARGRGLLFAPGGSLTFSRDKKTVSKGFNPRISLAWEITDTLMIYGAYSKGYRLGGPNLVPSTSVSQTKIEYGPDELSNYELGIRSSWFNDVLVADLTGYYLDWKDIPLQVTDQMGLFNFLDNVGDARIRGIEAAVRLRISDNITYNSSVTWNDAELLNQYDPKNGRPPVEPGDRLPGSPEWTVSNTLIGQWYLGRFKPMVSLVHRYESKSPSSLSFKNVKKGGFSKFDIIVGFRYGNFGLKGFAKNLLDERGLSAVDSYNSPSDGSLYSREYLITPRTIGIELNYSTE